MEQRVKGMERVKRNRESGGLCNIHDVKDRELRAVNPEMIFPTVCK